MFSYLGQTKSKSERVDNQRKKREIIIKMLLFWYLIQIIPVICKMIYNRVC